MKKILILLIIFLTGCMKYTDLKELSIIKSIGISYNETYTLYTQIYDDIKKDNEPKTKVIKTYGKTIKEVFDNLKLLSDKEIFFSHIDLLVLDKSLTNTNYQEIINYFINNKYFRNDFNVILSEDIYSLLDKTKYNKLEDYINANQETKKIIKTSFDQLINSYLTNKTFTLSLISYQGNIKYLGNYQYQNNKLERLSNEKN